MKVFLEKGLLGYFAVVFDLSVRLSLHGTGPVHILLPQLMTEQVFRLIISCRPHDQPQQVYDGFSLSSLSGNKAKDVTLIRLVSYMCAVAY